MSARMKILQPRAKRLLLMLVLATAGAGCTFDQFKRFAYEQGEQYRCTQTANHKPNESMEDLKCMSPDRPQDLSYDEYQQAREQAKRD
jgi:hypothetical protein